MVMFDRTGQYPSIRRTATNVTRLREHRETGVYYDDESFFVFFEGEFITSVLNAAYGREVLEAHRAQVNRTRRKAV
jgi:hypothetical protein